MQAVASAATLRRALGDWLNPMPWDFFATLTFTREATVDAARRQVERYFRWIAPSVRAHFWAVERGCLGRVHAHALMRTAGGVESRWLEGAWRCGVARCAPYDARRGASYYVGKAITQEDADYDLSL